MLRTTRSSVTSASKVDDDEVVGAGIAGVESGRSISELEYRVMLFPTSGNDTYGLYLRDLLKYRHAFFHS